MRTFRCFAEGDSQGWQALCLDLDLAVEGGSYDDVRVKLDEVIAVYLEEAAKEKPSDAKRLLNRRAPWWVRLSYAARYLTHSLSRSDTSLLAGFDLPCPA